MAVTQAEALSVLSLSRMKLELRIEDSETSHDDLITAQITAAVSFVKQSTGRGLVDLAELRPAVVSAVRQQYDGGAEVPEHAAFNRWMQPFRSYKPG